MKIKIILMLVFVVILAASTVSAQPGRKIAFSGTEYFDPFGIMGMPIGEFLEPGTVQCPGYEPTGNPLQPCPAESRTHLRDVKWRSRYVSSTMGFSDGWFTVIANSNLDADFTGPQWGTFSLAFDSGGTLDGTWQGVRYKDGNQWVAPLHTSGQVTGGAFDGANVVGTDKITSFTPIPIAYTGNVEGLLLQPR